MLVKKIVNPNEIYNILLKVREYFYKLNSWKLLFIILINVELVEGENIISRDSQIEKQN